MVNLNNVAALAVLAATARAIKVEKDAVPDAAHPKLLDLSSYTCTHPTYKTHIFSTTPLVIYLEDFITPEERAHLQALADPHFRASTVLSAEGSVELQSIRSSQSTTLPRDAVVACVEERSLDFQGYDLPAAHVEGIQLVKYGETERYNFHTDWFTDAQHRVASLGGNRISSFFGYIKAANVTGGGTNFPSLTPSRSEKWCRFVDCDQPYDNGVTFRPTEGNAVFWENLLESGWGDMRVMHAGLPVVHGQKIGMNIWTRQGPVSYDWTS